MNDAGTKTSSPDASPEGAAKTEPTEGVPVAASSASRAGAVISSESAEAQHEPEATRETAGVDEARIDSPSVDRPREPAPPSESASQEKKAAVVSVDSSAGASPAAVAKPSAGARVASVFGAIWAGLRRFDARVQAKVDFFDPNDDPDAEKLSAVALIVIGVQIGFAIWMFLRWYIQPMQDAGMHIGHTGAVTDWGRPGAIVTDIYKPIDPLAANTFLYVGAGYLGKLVGSFAAYRFFLCALYFVGLPLSNVYALRVFGRSAWGAVIAVPLLHGSVYVYGFSNMLVSAPFFVMSIPLLYRLTRKPTKLRALALTLCYVFVFLCHAHVYLWTGALAILVTIFGAVASLRAIVPAEAAVPRLKRLFWVLVSAGVAALPSFLLFYRWYYRTYGPGRDMVAGGVAEGINTGFGAIFLTEGDLGRVFLATQLTTREPHEETIWLRFLMLGIFAVALATLSARKKPPILELCFLLTFMSFGLLPEAISGQQVIATRQPAIALWLVSVFFVPVAWSTSKLARVLVIGLVTWHSWDHLSFWKASLVKFQQTEVAGFERVMAKAPKRKWLYFARNRSDSSVFLLHSFWHLDKYYGALGHGEAPGGTPTYFSTYALSRRPGAPLNWVTSMNGPWYTTEAVLRDYQLVLVFDGNETEQMVREKAPKVHLLERSGHFSLWEIDK